MKTPQRLEFTDCLGCGKRVATTAEICRHCNTERDPSQLSSFTKSKGKVYEKQDEDPADDDVESHGALHLGGYGQDDYDEEVDEQQQRTSKKNGLWWYVALALLIFFVLGALFPRLL